MESVKPAVAVIDPVGNKAGIDHYDILLLKGLHEAGHIVYLYSNFTYNGADIRYRKLFFNTGVSKTSAILSNFKGFFKALSDCRRNKVRWLILHVFRAGMFDLFTFALAKLMGFKICAVVHDIESLDTFTLPLVRKLVIAKLPDIRVVHNDFCRKELTHSLQLKNELSTAIVPHMNFTDLFDHYRSDPASLAALKQNASLSDGVSPELADLTEKNVPLILFFGQIKKAKGLDILLEAVAQTKQDYKLIIAGKTRNENWQFYDDKLTVLNIRNKVIPVIRHISDRERDLLFSICKGVVLPYKLIYQSGVLLMTMSFPLPIIASALPPNRDVLTDNLNGFLFEPGNSKQLAEKIDLLVSSADLSGIASKALEDVRVRYSYRKVGAMYSELLG